MSRLKTPRVTLCLLAALFTASLAAQSPAKPRGASAPPWRIKFLRFSDGKVLLGIPAGDVASHAHCANNGTSFLELATEDPAAERSAASDLYSVSSTGELKHVIRKVPVGFTQLSVRDFYAAEHTLVTLLRGELREDGDTTNPPREVRYFISTSDHDGDSADLLALDLKFKPMKVALFGSGDFLVLGWDEGNLVPLLVTLKPDGTIRRFIDLDRKPAEPYKTYNSIKDVEAAPETRADLAVLQRAAFVPSGSQVMLTYPGTAKSVRVLSSVGEDRVIPIALPGGFVLHDIFPAGDRYTLVLRAEEKPDTAPHAGAAPGPKPMLRMFAVDATGGSLISEYTFDRPSISDVTCAPGNKLTAIFYESVANVVQPAAGAAAPAQAPQTDANQLVLATASR